MIITEEMITHFVKRMNKHKRFVTHFANKMNYSFSEHDVDKFDDDVIEIQIKFSWSKFKKIPLSNEDIHLIDKVTLQHITTQQHHPEYWIEDKSILQNFTRRHPVYNLDCRKMSKTALIEMCCDWCAMGKEFHNTAIEWADKTVNKRWLFTGKQTNFIYDTLYGLSANEIF